MSHRFNVGRTVRLVRNIRNDHANGVCVVRQHLPAEGGDYQYRVKMADSGIERMVRESELVPS